MTATTAQDGGRATRLRRLGLTEDEARAVEHMWNWPALWLIANERILYFAENGYDAIDTLDAIWHGLDGVVGHTYMQHGLTPHQGFLIHNSPTASLNMWGPDRDIDRVHNLLGGSVPPVMVTVILLEADSPEEAERLIAHYVDPGTDYTD
ncbi:MAG: hypothetical protein LH477_09305, partial [Nocardioides sp.]|nr:hypothetical protein [Nocardioides sp.]